MVMTTPEHEDASIHDLLTDSRRTVSRFHDTVAVPELILDEAGIDALIGVLAGARDGIRRFSREAREIRRAGPRPGGQGTEAGPE